MTVFSVENFLRERFFRDHGHLISPWNYGAAAAKACNEALLRRGWLRATNERVKSYKTVVMVPPKGAMSQTSAAFPDWMESVDKPPA